MNINKVFKSYEELTPERILQEFGVVVLKAEDFITFLQKEQLNDGKNADGEALRMRNGKKRYSKRTEEISRNPQEYGTTKPRKPKIAGQPYNFEWTGEFFDGLFIKVFVNENFRIEIDSKDKKSEILQRKYVKILGLAENNKEEFIKFVEIEIIKIINKRF